MDDKNAHNSYLFALSICHSHLIATIDRISNNLSQGSIITDNFSVKPSIIYFWVLRLVGDFKSAESWEPGRGWQWVILLIGCICCQNTKATNTYSSFIFHCLTLKNSEFIRRHYSRMKFFCTKIFLPSIYVKIMQLIDILNSSL